MEQQTVENRTGGKHLLREILFVLKKNLILLLVITIVATAIGGVYAFLRKPKYIATEQLLFSMGDRAYIADDINTMNAYKATIQSFANQGVVLDRANHYAKLYYTEMPTEEEYNAILEKDGQMNQDGSVNVSPYPPTLTYAGFEEISLDLLVLQVEMMESIMLSYNDEIAVWEKVIEKLENYADMSQGIADSIMIKENDQARKVLHQQAVVIGEERILSSIISSYDLDVLLLRQAIKCGTSQEQIEKDKAKLAQVIAVRENLKAILKESQENLQTLLEIGAAPIEGIPYRFDEADVFEKIYTAMGQPPVATVDDSQSSNKFKMYETISEAQVVRDDVKEEKQNFGEDAGDLLYDAESEEGKANAGKGTYITSGNVGILPTDTEEKSFVFGISYTDGNEKLAKEKVKILTLAYNIESSYFFTNMKASIDDLGLRSCTIDMSKSTIILLAFCIGIVLALIVVYLLYVLDKTIKSREDAEKVAGCPVLACIEPQEVKANG